jgi:peptidyl-tRNA hydrolase, PTH2 family
MEDHNSPEAMAKIAAQEDPIVMYLVVREALNMSIGKTAAQCAHASQIVLLQYFKEYQNWVHEHDNDMIEPIMPERIKIFYEWLNSSFRKVVLKADDKEWKKVQLQFVENVMRFTVIDAGLTEVPMGSETVMGIWPMLKSECPLILKKLQALK